MTVTDVFLLTSLFYVLLWFYIGSLDDSDDDTEPYCHENDVSSGQFEVLALDLEGVHDLKLHHPSSSVATSNQ